MLSLFKSIDVDTESMSTSLETEVATEGRVRRSNRDRYNIEVGLPLGELEADGIVHRDSPKWAAQQGISAILVFLPFHDCAGFCIWTDASGPQTRPIAKGSRYRESSPTDREMTEVNARSLNQRVQMVKFTVMRLSLSTA